MQDNLNIKIIAIVKNLRFTKGEYFHLFYAFIFTSMFFSDWSSYVNGNQTKEIILKAVSLLGSIALWSSSLIPAIKRAIAIAEKERSFKQDDNETQVVWLGKIVKRFKWFRLSYIYLVQAIFLVVFVVVDGPVIESLENDSFFLILMGISIVILWRLFARLSWTNLYFFIALVSLLSILSFISLFFMNEKYQSYLFILVSFTLPSALIIGFYYWIGSERISVKNTNFFLVEDYFQRTSKNKSLIALLLNSILAAHSLRVSIVFYILAIIYWPLTFIVQFAFFSLILYLLSLDKYIELMAILCLLYSFYRTIKSVPNIVREARGYHRIEASAALKLDKRSPILYLRSFQDDGLMTELEGTNFEKVISSVADAIGPTICIGDPEDDYPKAGALRTYVIEEDPKEWQSIVKNWMLQSRFITLVAGTTSYLKWEFFELVKAQLLDKTIIVFPPTLENKNQEIRWQHFKRYISEIHPLLNMEHVNPQLLIAISFDDESMPIFIYSSARNKHDYQWAIKIALYKKSFVN